MSDTRLPWLRALGVPSIESPDDMAAAAEILGFLPFFRWDAPGWSVEELCPSELWFSGEEGPWEWKGPTARLSRAAYGKFFGGKAGFVSRALLPDFCNWRRRGYDFDSLYEQGLVSRREKDLYDIIAAEGSLNTKELKKRAGYRKGGLKGFESVISRLQRETYLCVRDFTRMKDVCGNEYGWEVSVYDIPERIFGREFVRSRYDADPEESHLSLLSHLKSFAPTSLDEKHLSFLIG